MSLDRCSLLLGFAAAKQGIPLYKEIPGLFHCFQVKAAKIYGDTVKLRRFQEQYVAQMLEQLKQ